MKLKWSTHQTRILITSACALALAAGTAGCAGDGTKQPTQKETAVKQWNAARASVMASMARSQYDSGNFAQCEQTVRDALRLNPENAELHLINAKLCIERGQLDVADAELQLVRQYAPTNAEPEYLLGIVFERRGDDQQALDHYTIASEMMPTEVAYALARAEMLVALDRAREAIQYVEEKVLAFDQSAPLRDALGRLYVGQGRYAEGVVALRQAVSMAADDAAIREHLAMAYYFNKQYPEAAAIFQALLKNEATAARGEVWLALGECQMQSGQTREARSSFDRACLASPGSPRAWASHAKATLELGDTRRAEISLRKSLSLDPNSSESNLLLGYLKLKQDKLNEALAAFRKASALDPRDPVSLCMIGFVLEKSGKADQAIQYYGQALKVNPSDELATKLMASIDTNE